MSKCLNNPFPKEYTQELFSNSLSLIASTKKQISIVKVRVEMSYTTRTFTAAMDFFLQHPSALTFNEQILLPSLFSTILSVFFSPTDLKGLELLVLFFIF